MMQKIIVARLIAAASLFVSPIAASATTAASQSTNASTQPAASNINTAAATGEKKICKQLPSSSSRLPQRVCLTEKQWKQVDADSE